MLPRMQMWWLVQRGKGWWGWHAPRTPTCRSEGGATGRFWRGGGGDGHGSVVPPVGAFSCRRGSPVEGGSRGVCGGVLKIVLLLLIYVVVLMVVVVVGARIAWGAQGGRCSCGCGMCMCGGCFHSQNPLAAGVAAAGCWCCGLMMSLPPPSICLFLVHYRTRQRSQKLVDMEEVAERCVPVYIYMCVFEYV